jgi:hypothetical protein
VARYFSDPSGRAAQYRIRRRPGLA